MFGHLVLGLLCDGTARHGYELIRDFRRRSGRPLSSGNLYRELSRLSASGLVVESANPPDADARRVPYRITEAGRQAFDRWLASPRTVESEFEGWLTFLDRVPSDAVGRLLDRQLERLWMRGKELTEVRQEVGAADDPRSVLSLWLSLQTRHVAADVEFLHELLGQMGIAAGQPAEAAAPVRQNAVQRPARRPVAIRIKGRR